MLRVTMGSAGQGRGDDERYLPRTSRAVRLHQSLGVPLSPHTAFFAFIAVCHIVIVALRVRSAVVVVVCGASYIPRLSTHVAFSVGGPQ